MKQSKSHWKKEKKKKKKKKKKKRKKEKYPPLRIKIFFCLSHSPQLSQLRTGGILLFEF